MKQSSIIAASTKLSLHDLKSGARLGPAINVDSLVPRKRAARLQGSTDTGADLQMIRRRLVGSRFDRDSRNPSSYDDQD